MLYYFIFIANDIILLMMLLIDHFGWYNKLHLFMAIGCFFVAATDAYFLARRNYFLAKCTKKEKKWNIQNVAFWLIIDAAASLYFSGVLQ
jgi:Tfp pilus assembly protein PilZ